MNEPGVDSGSGLLAAATGFVVVAPLAGLVAYLIIGVLMAVPVALFPGTQGGQQFHQIAAVIAVGTGISLGLRTIVQIAGHERERKKHREQF